MFGIKFLYPAQLDALARLAMIKFKLSSYKPSPLLRMHTTGGGESLVHSVLFWGVSLIIVPNFALESVYCTFKLTHSRNHNCEYFGLLSYPVVQYLLYLTKVGARTHIQKTGLILNQHYFVQWGFLLYNRPFLFYTNYVCRVIK